VEIRFVAQPFEGGTDLRDFLHAVAEDHGLNTLRIVVAWAKRSGLGRAISDLQAVRSRGGKILAIVGISEGGATEQGLKALLGLTDEAYVFHDTGRTFHPKIYLADGPGHALLLVGSHNLTAGGIAWNYEAGLWCYLDLATAADKQVHDAIIAYFDQLISDTAVCIALNDVSLSAILADASLLIQNEDVRNKPHSAEPDAPEESDSSGTAQDDSAVSVFGKSQQKKRKAPRPVPQGPHARPPRKPAPVAGSISGARPPMAVLKRWYRQLDGTAAQQPPGANSNPTGNLRLIEEDFSIDHTTYFFEVLFGGLDWRPNARIPEKSEVWVPMQTVIAGDYLGEVMLLISHQPSRAASQGNVTTVLHWGDLGARMRQNNYVGLYVNIERGPSEQFRLTIASEPTGPFIY
jgi:phospholipase D-like protein